MFKDRDKLYQVYHTLLSMALTWALTLAINEYFVLRVHVVASALFSFVLAALVYLFDCNRKNTVSYLMLFGLFPVAGLFFWIRSINPITWLRDMANWVYEYDCTEELYVASHAYFILLGIAIVGAILFYLLMKKNWAKLFVAVFVFLLLILLSIYHIDINKMVIGISIFYFLTIMVEVCGRIYSRKLGKPEKKAGILYLAPICLLLAVISVGLPSKPEPIQWKGVKYIYNGIKDKIDNLMTEWEFFRGKGMGEFSLSLTGYSEDSGKLSNGDLEQDDKAALYITVYQGNAPIYLIGSVSDVYTGHSWEKSRMDNIPGEEEYLLDYMELIYALSRQEIEVLENSRFVDRRILKTEFHNIRTKTFFYPTKSSWYEIYSNTKKPNAEYSNIIFPNAVGEGTSYQNVFFDMNLQGSEFQQMLRDADSFSYEVSGDMNVEKIQWLEDGIFYHDSADSIMKNWNFYELLRERAEIIRERYTNLPEELPVRIKELAIEITKEAATTYDKLKAIEEYLRAYEYNVKPGKVPKGADFVDYFLFDNKKGYCTSFATTMAVLARCIDIPTRYVEGFVVDYSEKIDSSFVVRNNKAHSWVEAYIEGVGWIPFEATPPFYSKRYVKWRETTAKSNSVAPDYSSRYENEPTSTPMELEREVKGRKEGISGSLMGGIILVSAILILWMLLVVYYIVLRYRYHKAFHKADYSRRMYLLFLRILTMLKKEGFTLEPQETILMLAGRLKDHYHYDRVIFADVAEVFMRYRYAELETTQKEYEKVEGFYQGLKDKHRQETGRFMVHLEEFLFLTKRSNR